MVGLPDFGYDEDGSGDISGKFIISRTQAFQAANELYLGRGDGRGSTMSTPLHPSSKRYPQDDEDDYQTPGQSARSRYKRPKRESSLNRSVGQQRLILKTKMENTPDAASPAPPGSGHPILNRFVAEPSLPQQSSARRPRPLTQHQLAVEQNRRQRIEYLLAKRKGEAYRVLRAKRESEIPIVRHGRLLSTLPDDYDTDDEENSWGKGGLIPKPDEEEDFGECASYYLSVIRKASRRLDRWDYDDANGPKRDRKKEREQRQKARQIRLAMENSADLGGRAPSSARSRARAARNAKRKLAGAASGTAAELKEQGASTSSRAKSNRNRAQRDADGAETATPGVTKDGLDVPSRDQELSPMPGSAQLGDDDGDLEAEEGLDDIDREILGEGSGEEEVGPTRKARTSHPAEVGYEDSFIGEGGDPDEEAEALSSDENDEEADDDDLEEGDGDVDGDDNSSTMEGGNGYAASDISSVAEDAAEPAAEAGGETARRAEVKDETMED